MMIDQEKLQIIAVVVDRKKVLIVVAVRLVLILVVVDRKRVLIVVVAVRPVLVVVVIPSSDDTPGSERASAIEYPLE
jgi:hypothetical protein